MIGKSLKTNNIYQAVEGFCIRVFLVDERQAVLKTTGEQTDLIGEFRFNSYLYKNSGSFIGPSRETK